VNNSHHNLKSLMSLLDQQLKRLEKDFVEQGGLREQMTRARLAERDRQGGWKP
jgi:four helix bundle suffix protein